MSNDLSRLAAGFASAPLAPVDLTAEDALRLVGAEHPALAGRSARWNEQGWDNRVLEIDGGDDGDLIVRFPRESSFPSALELAILTALRGKVDVAIPDPRYLGRAHRYMAYRRIDGSHLTDELYARLDPCARERLGAQIATFLWTVHSELEVRVFEPFGITRERWLARFESELSVLETVPMAGICELAHAALADYAAVHARTGDLVLLFNDLHDENMLLDEDGRLCGVVDFGDVAFGDRHWEFRYFFWLNEDLLEHAMAAYRTLSGKSLEKGVIRLCGVVQALCEIALAHRNPASRVPVERMQARVRRYIARGPELWRSAD